jgi:chromosome segregation ATPase
VARSQAEIQRLERDLASQESHSKQASKRLQQQDQAIAELQKQLHELQARSPAGQH